MRIINVIEDTEGAAGCIFAHGLSFYIETDKHKLLMDLGPSQDTLKNAAVLGIDLKAVDTVILSHGHYDHSGGILPFADINAGATIYMQESAAGEFYADDAEAARCDNGEEGAENAPGNRGSDDGGRYRFIGIDGRIASLPGVRFVDGDKVIDDELSLFVVKQRTHELPSTNRRILMKKDGRYVRDDFRHEHFLVVRSGGKSVLVSGCAHTGILSILDAYAQKFGSYPDAAVSGFHLMKKSPYTKDEVKEIEDIARELSGYPTKFCTCHCTGVPAFELMKKIMGDRLIYVHSGEEVFL